MPIASREILAGETWPSLALEAWSDTYATLHLWTQIVGKIRLAQTPWTNHSWHVTLYVTPRGLTTGSIPYGSGAFQIDFDFVEHELNDDVNSANPLPLPSLVLGNLGPTDERDVYTFEGVTVGAARVSKAGCTLARISLIGERGSRSPSLRPIAISRYAS